MPGVIVVPETSDFEHDVSHKNVIWINKNLGVPKLDDHDAHYIAPLWIGEKPGVNRIYHILSVDDVGHSTELKLGNSFVLKQPWREAGQHRRFEYHQLSDFGFVQVCPGLLVPIK